MSLTLRGVKKSYPDFEIDVSFTAEKGELLTLLGPSGCGKTTTLHIIAGFIYPDMGEIVIDGQRVNEQPPYMRRVGLVFQDYALFPNMNVFGNIAFGLRMQGWNKTDTEKRVKYLLNLIHLPGYGKRNVTELSGGEQQRVALARALAPGPRILLLDEPLSALDARLRKDLRSEVKRIQRELKLTTVYVTHDQEEAFALSDKIVVIREGHVEQIGNASDVYNKPETRFTADFVGMSNKINARLIQQNGETAEFESSEGRFSVNFPGKLKTGLKVTILVRPEKCVLLKEKKGINAVNGMARNCEYLGESTYLEISTKNGMFTAKLPGKVSCTAGETVSIGFSPEDCWILANDSIEL